MSPHYFSAQFKKATGSTPHQYVLLRRIEFARDLLRSEPISVAEVSERVGFRTQEHFTKVFRKLTGVTPSLFRRRNSLLNTNH